MTLGELADKLEELRSAEENVRDWQSALGRGHPDNIARKEAALADAEEYVARLRAQEIPL